MGAANRTRIVATIGPASWTPATIDALLDAGMDVARINCAHGTRESMAEMIRTLRRQAENRGVPLSILTDLAGPKLRVGRLVGGGVELRAEARFTLTTMEQLGSAERAWVNHSGLPADVSPGDDVFLNDGLIRLEVTRVHGTEIDTIVRVGGWLSDGKGLSVPSAEISTESLTPKDLDDLDFIATQPIDYVGLSFVRSEKDIELLRRELSARSADVRIVAKIEKRQAVERLDAIVREADAVMVARGDLGVECPIEDGPVLQKKIIGACNRAAKPVITATQMLESMVDHPRPTRAEASDVANAVLDGTDAVMLSAETATGRYPVDVVRTMSRIIARTEAFAVQGARSMEHQSTLELHDSVGRSACLAADSMDAGLIVCLTQTGVSVRFLSRWRPRQPILAVTPVPETWRRLNLFWGVQPYLSDPFSDRFNVQCDRILTLLRAEGLGLGRPVVITAGLPFSERGRTNTIRIESL